MPKISEKRLKGGYQGSLSPRVNTGWGKKTSSPRSPFFAALHVDHLDQHHRPSEHRLDHFDHLKEHYRDHIWSYHMPCWKKQCLVVVKDVEQMSASVRRNGWERKIMGLVLSSLSSLCFYKLFMALSIYLCSAITFKMKICSLLFNSSKTIVNSIVTSALSYILFVFWYVLHSHCSP